MDFINNSQWVKEIGAVIIVEIFAIGLHLLSKKYFEKVHKKLPVAGTKSIEDSITNSIKRLVFISSFREVAFFWNILIFTWGTVIVLILRLLLNIGITFPPEFGFIPSWFMQSIATLINLGIIFVAAGWICAVIIMLFIAGILSAIHGKN